jgi:hypothetical protein
MAPTYRTRLSATSCREGVRKVDEEGVAATGGRVGDFGTESVPPASGVPPAARMASASARIEGFAYCIAS